MEARQAGLGADHPETLQAVNDLGVNYTDRGWYDKAEPLLTKVLEARRVKLGSDHLDSLESMYEVAELYEELGRYEDAEPLYKQAMEGRLAKLGADHPLTLLTISATGNCTSYGSDMSMPSRCSSKSWTRASPSSATTIPTRSGFGAISRFSTSIAAPR